MKTYKVIIEDNGDKIWYLNGQRHREDGPAAEYANGDKSWYLNGKCHREDGPAVEYADGAKSWYLEGNHYTEDEWKAKVTHVAICPTELTVDEISKLLGYEIKIVKG